MNDSINLYCMGSHNKLVEALLRSSNEYVELKD